MVANNRGAGSRDARNETTREKKITITCSALRKSGETEVNNMVTDIEGITGEISQEIAAEEASFGQESRDDVPPQLLIARDS